MQNLLLAYDEIAAAAATSTNEPLTASRVGEGDEEAVKIVNIVRGAEPIGASIKEGPSGEIIITRVRPDGAAARSGCIRAGDRILEVNNVAPRRPADVLKLIAHSTDELISLTLAPSGDEAPSRQPTTSTPSGGVAFSRYFVRAHIDYQAADDLAHPCRAAALAFQCDDILEIVEPREGESWQKARVVGHSTLITRDTHEGWPILSIFLCDELMFFWLADSPNVAMNIAFSPDDLCAAAAQPSQTGLIPTEVTLRQRFEGGRRHQFACDQTTSRSFRVRRVAG